MGFPALIILVAAIILMGCMATENPWPPGTNTSGQAAPVDRDLYHMTFIITATPAPSPVQGMPTPTQKIIQLTPGYRVLSTSGP